MGWTLEQARSTNKIDTRVIMNDACVNHRYYRLRNRDVKQNYGIPKRTKW